MPKSQGFGSVFINGDNYEVIKVGDSLIKRRYDMPDNIGYTVLKIKCSSGSNVLNIFNQLNSNIESIKIINESTNINVNTKTTLPNLNVDSESTNQYTTWTLSNGTYKVFIRGEFSIKNSTCEILKVQFQNNLTTGYKMFYNCNIVKANSDYEIKIPNSMVNTKSMFENSNINHTAKVNLLTTTNCYAMYRNCNNLKRIHMNYIEVFDNENRLSPNLLEENHYECFIGCENIRCSNKEGDINNKPKVFLWNDIPYTWGGPESLNVFEVVMNSTNGMTLTLVQNYYDETDTESLLTLSYYKDEFKNKRNKKEILSKKNEEEVILSKYVPSGNFEELSETDWGDGTINMEASHTYNTEGIYLVKTKLQVNNISSWLTNTNITRIKQIRNDVTNLQYAFANCESLVSVDTINFNNRNKIKNAEYLFNYCYNLTSIDITKWNLKNIDYISGLFSDCNSLKTIIGIEDLDISNTIDASYILSGTAITTLDVNRWNISNVKYINGLFSYCNELTSVTGIRNWQSNGVERISGLFAYSAKLRSIDLTGFDTSKVVNASYLFENCKELVSVTGLNTWNTDNFETIHSMFFHCEKLESIDLTGWNISKVTSLFNMFAYCTSITSIKGIENWDVSNITEMYQVFRESKLLKTLDLSKWNVSKVTNFNRFLNQCHSLETAGDLSNWKTPALTDADYMFNQAHKLKTLKLTNFDTSKLTNAAHIFNCGDDAMEEYDIVLTYNETTNISFNSFSFTYRIKYITIKGTPNVQQITSLVNILRNHTTDGAILDISNLSSEITNILTTNTTLITNMTNIGWVFFTSDLVQ